MKLLFTALVLLALIGGTVGCAGGPTIESEQVDNMIGLRWEPVDGALFYEVRAQFLDNDFTTLTLTLEPQLLVTSIPVGVHTFYIQAWLVDGTTRNVGMTKRFIIKPVVYEAPPTNIPSRDKV
jgi:hypothetical protein